MIKIYKKTGDPDYFSRAKVLSKRIKKDLKKEIRTITQKKATTPNTKTFWNLVSGLMGK